MTTLCPYLKSHRPTWTDANENHSHVGGGNETHSHLRRARQPTRKPQVKTKKQIGVKVKTKKQIGVKVKRGLSPTKIITNLCEFFTLLLDHI